MISLSVCVSVYVSVCLSASISLEPLDQYSRHFLCRSPVAMARALGPPLVVLQYVMYFWFYG